MTRETLEKVVSEAVGFANGKSRKEAISIMCDRIEASLLTDAFSVSDPDTWAAPIAPDPEPESFPNPIIISPSDDRILELAPIRPGNIPVVKPGEDKHREYHQVDDIVGLLTNKCPADISVVPDGWDSPLRLRRHISNMGTSPGGVQLSYRPDGATSETPFPKEHFWTTDEHIDIQAALKKIHADAIKMYIRRTSPVTVRVQQMAPVEQRMNKAGEVN